MKKPVNIIVFTLSTPFERVIETLEGVKNTYQTILLSPHHVFNNENTIPHKSKKRYSYKSFYQYINESEMINCDIEADNEVISLNSSRKGKLKDYFNTIKHFKNERIIKNIHKSHIPYEKYILADDLGIDIKCWVENGFKPAVINKKNKKNFYIIIKKILLSVEISIIEFNNEKFYILGKYRRIKQYLDKESITKEDASVFEKIIFNTQYKLIAIQNQNLYLASPIARTLSKAVLVCTKSLSMQPHRTLLTPVHSYTDEIGLMAEQLQVKSIVLQDGYLPSNYTSKYPRYFYNVDSFFTWDKPSSRIFDNNSLTSSRWRGFKDQTLPRVSLPDKVTTVLFLASGAGDWTAQKNRSDEDLTYLALLEAAIDLSHIKFLYRPHPLWLHPEHQGVNSIQRIIEYTARAAPKNFTVSLGALREGKDFTIHNNLSIGSTTIDDDINSADIVFGDHSQSLIQAAQKEKIIAAINLSRRDTFFSNYTDIGFPCLESKEQIVDFLTNIENNDKFLFSYNSCIDQYNNELL